MIIVSVEDNLAKNFANPFFVEKEDEAIRMFKLAVNDSKNDMLYNFPEDYALWYLGEFDNKTGLIIPEPRKIIDAKALRKDY